MANSGFSLFTREDGICTCSMADPDEGWDLGAQSESGRCLTCLYGSDSAGFRPGRTGTVLESYVCDTGRPQVLVPKVSHEGPFSRSDVDFWVDAHERVCASGLFNYQLCRIPVRSGLVIPSWKSWFQRSACPDVSLVGFLEFGWPLGFTGVELPKGGDKNHQGAEVFEEETVRYLSKEMDMGAIVGPFGSNPLSSPLVFSPINSIPKKGSEGRRFVSDLSFPKGLSVNDGIDLNDYLGESCVFSYPTVDDFVAMVRSQGVGALMYKKDLSRAFRQFFLDPGDIRY